MKTIVGVFQVPSDVIAFCVGRSNRITLSEYVTTLRHSASSLLNITQLNIKYAVVETLNFGIKSIYSTHTDPTKPVPR